VPKPFTLNENHRLAIALLAGGATKKATAVELNISRPTLNAWCKRSEFASELEAEIERRKERAADGYRAATDDAQDATVAAFRNDLEEYKKQLILSQKARIGRGLKLLKKAGQRFDDLPAEAIPIKDLVGLIIAGDRLVQSGFDQWSEVLAIDELIESLPDIEV